MGCVRMLVGTWGARGGPTPSLSHPWIQREQSIFPFQQVEGERIFCEDEGVLILLKVSWEATGRDQTKN
jgi:hypothetical protein